LPELRPIWEVTKLDLISALVAIFPEGLAWLRNGLLTATGWICLAFVLVGGSMVSIALAQTRGKRARSK
jgi:hypothetical protein